MRWEVTGRISAVCAIPFLLLLVIRDVISQRNCTTFAHPRIRIVAIDKKENWMQKKKPKQKKTSLEKRNGKKRNQFFELQDNKKYATVIISIVRTAAQTQTLRFLIDVSSVNTTKNQFNSDVIKQEVRTYLLNSGTYSTSQTCFLVDGRRDCAPLPLFCTLPHFLPRPLAV